MAFFIDAGAVCPMKDRPKDWYLRWWTQNYKLWEGRTFVIFDTFLDARHSYVDVGAWIGPTVLYAAAKARHVYCLEPDPEAYRVLSLNLSVNPQYRNITALNSALSDSDGYRTLTAAGELGRSESTMLPRGAADRHIVVRVPGITVETLVREYSVTDCSLVKIDIEGGELIVVPAIASFLRNQRPALYLSIHWGALAVEEVESIIDLLLSIYDFVYDDSLRRTLDKRRIVSERISSIVCTSRPITARQRLAAWRMVFFQRLGGFLHSALRPGHVRRV